MGFDRHIYAYLVYRQVIATGRPATRRILIHAARIIVLSFDQCWSQAWTTSTQIPSSLLPLITTSSTRLSRLLSVLILGIFEMLSGDSSLFRAHRSKVVIVELNWAELN